MKKYEEYQFEKEVLQARRRRLEAEISRRESTIDKLYKAVKDEDFDEANDEIEQNRKMLRKLWNEEKRCIERILEIKWEMEELDSALARAPDIQTKVKILRGLCGYNLREIAERLGYSYGYIRNLMSKNKCDNLCDSVFLMSAEDSDFFKKDANR